MTRSDHNMTAMLIGSLAAAIILYMMRLKEFAFVFAVIYLGLMLVEFSHRSKNRKIRRKVRERIAQIIDALQKCNGLEKGLYGRGELWFRFFFPWDYNEFLMISDGAHGMVGKTKIDLWSLQQVVERNPGWKASPNTSNFLFFASDAIAKRYAFQYTRGQKNCVVVEVVKDKTSFFADNFLDFLEKLHAA